MPVPADLYDRISGLIADNRINSAIELLEDQLPTLQAEDPSRYHSALVLLQDFNDIQEKKISGLLLAEDAGRSISLRLLDLVKSIKDGPRKNYRVPSPPPSPDPLGVAQTGYTNVNEQARRRAFQDQQAAGKKKGGGFGKIVMYVLAGLGSLVVIGLFMPADGYEDTEPYYPPIIEPVSPGFTNSGGGGTDVPDPSVAPAPAPQPVISPTPTIDESLETKVRRMFGGTSWHNNQFGWAQFNAEGTMASYQNGTASFTIMGIEDDGRIFASFSESLTQLNGMAYLGLAGNGQQLEIAVINIETHEVLPSFFLNRQ